MAANKRTTNALGNGKTEVTTFCPYHTGYNEKIVVETRLWNRYESGNGLVQDLFPDLSDDEREMLMSGICPPCWDEILGPLDPEKVEVDEALS